MRIGVPKESKAHEYRVGLTPESVREFLRPVTHLAIAASLEFALKPPEAALQRFPITWNHVIDKEPRRIKELEHVGIEKVEQLL